MIMSMHSEYKDWFSKHRKKIQEDYFAFLRYRSISTEPEFQKELIGCAEWVKTYLAKIGFQSELIPTENFPIVFAENNLAGKEKPTLLIYGHYDVQPVDPLDLWKSPPFEPTERDGKIFARGALDDKGQIFYAMAAMKALFDLGKPLPINVKFCIEGEEEAGSVGLESVLSKIGPKLKADYLLVVDYGSYDEKTPSINLGARGILTMDVSLTGSSGDLHSGVCGGIAYNPNRALSEMLSKLYHPDGRVAVDGFYDDVKEPTEFEKKTFSLNFDQKYYAKQFGITAFGGEQGRTISESNLFRPVLEINGIGGGYTGSGFKTVIPAKAIAKISCRLVPGQDPKKIGRCISEFLHRHCAKGMKLEVAVQSGAAAYRANPQSALANAVAAASEEVMGEKCLKELSGASVPIVGALSKAAGAEVVGMGYGLPTDQIHAPNEHFDMKRFEQGFLTVARTLELL